jgi:hypothetical protein
MLTVVIIGYQNKQTARHQQAHHRGSGSHPHQVIEEQDCRIHFSLDETLKAGC